MSSVSLEKSYFLRKTRFFPKFYDFNTTYNVQNFCYYCSKVLENFILGLVEPYCTYWCRKKSKNSRVQQ